MRPVSKGACPISGDYSDYHDAKSPLKSRIGSGLNNSRYVGCYCSYCERKIETNLAVEHLEPKDGVHGNPLKIGKWSNFLLACVNCNSTKGSKQVLFQNLFFPDRDNTLAAFEYLPDGNIMPANGVNPIIAQATLELTGLNKEKRQTQDENGLLVPEDRASQRLEAWILAEEARNDFQNQKLPLKWVVINALNCGFFSVWMTVFSSYPDVRNALIDAFAGTRASGCFDSITAALISPAPNPDGLAHGGKI